MDGEAFLDRYEAFLLSRGLTSSTARMYRRWARLILQSRQRPEDWLRANAPYYSPITRRSLLSTARYLHVFRRAERRGHKPVLTPDQVKVLRSAIEDEPAPHAPMLLILLGCAVPLKALCACHMTDREPRGRHLGLQTPQGWFPLSKEAAEVLREYIAWAKLAQTQPLFEGVTAYSVRSALRRVEKRLVAGGHAWAKKLNISFLQQVYLSRLFAEGATLADLRWLTGSAVSRR